MKQIVFTKTFSEALPEIKQAVREAIIEMADAFDEIRGQRKEELPQEKQYLTVKETCDLLNISRPTLRKYTEQGRYNAYKVDGRRLMYFREEIELALRNQKIKNLMI